jgi:hypothetical protein
MKFLFTIIVIISTLSLFSQDRGDNTVIIHTELNYDEAFRTVGRLFVSKGLTIDDANLDFGTISASGLDVGTMADGYWELSVSAILHNKENTKIELIGINKCIKRHETRRPEIVRLSAMGALGKSWALFLEMANSFDAATIEFEKRN